MLIEEKQTAYLKSTLQIDRKAICPKRYRLPKDVSNSVKQTQLNMDVVFMEAAIKFAICRTDKFPHKILDLVPYVA